MKKMLLFLFLMVISVTAFAQNYPHVTIRDIQYINPDSVSSGCEIQSQLAGDTVNVTGVVMVAPYRDANPDSGTTLIAGAPALILQDTADTEWAGILVRYPNMPAGNAFGLIDTGYVVNVTGVVVPYFNTTELDLIEFDAAGVVGFMQRPQPIHLTMDSLAETGSLQGLCKGAKWESMFVEVDTVTATSGGVGTGSYIIYDQNNTQVITGNQSSYFRNATVPVPGTILGKVVGYIQNRDNVPNTTYANLINPAYPGDVTVASFSPSISNLTRDPANVGYGDQVTISSQIVDPDGSVASAKLYYRKNSEADVELTLNNSSGDTWEAVLPAQNDSCVISYFVWAEDNSGLQSVYPADTARSRFFYLVLPNRALNIRDVQFSPFGGGYSSFSGYDVTVTGVVTADTSDINGNETGTLTGSQVYIQDGQGPWSGVRINGTEVLNLNSGDDVTVTGTVSESNGLTQVGGIDASSNITVNSIGNALPTAEDLLTSVIDRKTNGTVDAEQWEGVLVKYSNLTVTDENADGNPGPEEGSGGNRNFGDILVADGSGSNTRIDLEDGNHDYNNWWFAGQDTLPTYVSTGSTFESVTGVVYYAFSNYKLVPRKNNDIVGFTTDVKDEANSQPTAYHLNQNYPNPFNPSTIISYSIPYSGLVTVKVYNMLGQEVQTLVNQFQSSGNHQVTFNGSSLSSGVYLYRINSENYNMVRKMVLLK